MKKLLALAGLTGMICLSAYSAIGADLVDGKVLFNRSCAGCHKPDGSGSTAAPSLKGLKPEEVTQKLQGYQAGTYGGAKKATMETILKTKTPEQVKALADYIGTL